MKPRKRRDESTQRLIARRKEISEGKIGPQIKKVVARKKAKKATGQERLREKAEQFTQLVINSNGRVQVTEAQKKLKIKNTKYFDEIVQKAVELEKESVMGLNDVSSWVIQRHHRKSSIDKRYADRTQRQYK